MTPSYWVALCLLLLQLWTFWMLASAGCIFPSQLAHTQGHHSVILVIDVVLPAASSAQNESQLHHDPKDSRGNCGIMGTRGLTCNWYPTSPLSASCSGRLVSAPGRPGPKFAHSSSQNLQIMESSDGSVENKDFVQGIYQYLSVPSFDQELTSALLGYQL